MLLVTSEQMREIDRRAMDEYGIPGLLLMENAGRRVAEEAARRLGGAAGRRVVVYAGKGNNGGDGLVAARHLANAGARVLVILAAGDQMPPDAARNLDIARRMGLDIIPPGPDVGPILALSDLVIDALLGIGVKGEVKGPLAEAIEMINAARRLVLAVDVPSGLDADTGKIAGCCVRAGVTVTLALPKRGLYLYPGAAYVGELVVADISIPAALCRSVAGAVELLDSRRIRVCLPPRPADAHKGTFGHVLVVAGSRGYTGAAALCCRGALRAGAGLVTLGIPESLNPVMEVKLTEPMTLPLPETPSGSLAAAAAPVIRRFARPGMVLALGPGLSRQPETAELIAELVDKIDLPVVLDADALNALGTNPAALRRRKAGTVITPHPGEMGRLLGRNAASVQEDRPGTAREAARQSGAVVVLKGAPTVIAGPDGTLYLNPTGNAGLASGGTGDVLTGIIAGLLAQGASPLDAALAGVYVHGLAGDRAAREAGQRGMSAGDVVDALRRTFRDIENEPDPAGAGS